MQHEIEKILNNNLGNRLTNELVIGLTALLGHQCRIAIDAAAQDARQQVMSELAQVDPPAPAAKASPVRRRAAGKKG
ncbi:hypothetical protein RE432_14770 [Pusillimonas sp. SM2304]|uniref:hypothetical protein n=1 Tax=Pusillimonas sp. SM2304 TaxID=3073241 RepID=UPI002874F6C3|nr:hypothetical protein [Pusillimonas sp. SM2304]MDS1141702.1 hypothetical protein [Pusillimonas sp. SM2304]